MNFSQNLTLTQIGRERIHKELQANIRQEISL
jgi:hypothetical protein